jgi:nitrogen regulatory protein P-II 1
VTLGSLFESPFLEERSMKLVVAVIRPEKLEAVQAALQEAEACLLCVSQVVGDRRDDGFTEIYRGREVRVPRPKLRLEIAVNDALVQGTVEVIARAASIGGPGRQGNGNVFVMQLEACLCIPGDAEPPGHWRLRNQRKILRTTVR